MNASLDFVTVADFSTEWITITIARALKKETISLCEEWKSIYDQKTSKNYTKIK